MGQPLVKVGSTGEAVRYLQQSLTKLGYNPGIIDGIFE
jgi:peptidoglycan hydrolase-like protein with peptidoglycan-binding domain